MRQPDYYQIFIDDEWVCDFQDYEDAVTYAENSDPEYKTEIRKFFI